MNFLKITLVFRFIFQYLINIVISLLTCTKKYDMTTFIILKDNIERIKDIYYEKHHNIKRYHDGKRTYYKVKDFPEIQELINIIPGVKKDSAVIYVMDFPMTIKPPKAYKNRWLRYELVLRGGRGCIIDTGKECKMVMDGNDILYDPSCRHKYVKRSIFTRLSLALDVDRFAL